MDERPRNAYGLPMDWLWLLYEEYVGREAAAAQISGQAELQDFFIKTLQESTATLYAIAPHAGTVRFKGLGRWSLTEVPGLLTDPHAFIADEFGGGKFKINFHHLYTFVATHNFRTWGDPLWIDKPEYSYD